YDIFINKIGEINAKSLIEYAFKKKVIICSPSGFYAYLQTVIQGMRSLQIEQQAKEIQKYVVKLGEDLERFESRYSSLGKSLGTAVKHYDSASTSFKKIDKDILNITDGSVGGKLELPEIDKPENIA
ncbi:DNA recombination protein RmuC, partial [Candidatus Gracilibacteria bacterium]|nr:DNA recombination protein RmuC [Candidatus Gracilibacteria bacterium]